jgi:CheY-like chemotaxis protein
MRILVVDDVPVVCGLIADLFQRNGHEAHACVHSEHAPELLQRLRPDVLILDIEMPGVNGFQIAGQLKDLPMLRPKRMVALTGYNDPVMRAKIAAAGFDYHLVKPVGWPELSKVLPSTDGESS